MFTWFYFILGSEDLIWLASEYTSGVNAWNCYFHSQMALIYLMHWVQVKMELCVALSWEYLGFVSFSPLVVFAVCILFVTVHCCLFNHIQSQSCLHLRCTLFCSSDIMQLLRFKFYIFLWCFCLHLSGVQWLIFQCFCLWCCAYWMFYRSYLGWFKTSIRYFLVTNHVINRICLSIDF